MKYRKKVGYARVRDKQDAGGQTVLKRLLFAGGLTLLILSTLLVISVNPILKTVMPTEYEKLVKKYAREYGVEEALVFAVIKTESSFNPEAVSNMGAKGLMQIMPSTFTWLQTKTGEKHEEEMLFDPEISVKYGTFFLSLLLKEFNNTDTAIAAYNAGMNGVARWLKDKDLSDDGVTLKYIPITETRYYVKKVNTALAWYRKLYDFGVPETAETTVVADMSRTEKGTR